MAEVTLLAPCTLSVCWVTSDEVDVDCVFSSVFVFLTCATIADAVLPRCSEIVDRSVLRADLVGSIVVLAAVRMLLVDWTAGVVMFLRPAAFKAVKKISHRHWRPLRSYAMDVSVYAKSSSQLWMLLVIPLFGPSPFLALGAGDS